MQSGDMKKLFHRIGYGNLKLNGKFPPRCLFSGKTLNQTTTKSHIQNLFLLLALFAGVCQAAAQNFIISSSLRVAGGAVWACAADVNGDGNVDLICANYGKTLTVLTNNGSGGFVTSGTYNVGGSPKSVCAADVNGDGKMDLICANSGYGPNDNSLTVLTNNGSGGFVTASTNGLDSSPNIICAADVNGDGKVDLICANSSSGDMPMVLTNNGSGGFVLASSPGLGSGPSSLCVADVNGDGKMDLIFGQDNGNNAPTLTILTNNGSGGFALASFISVGSERSMPNFVCAVDVNGDGKVDLISANSGISGDPTLTVLTNDGSGGFAASGTYDLGEHPVPVCADVNGDGKIDLICANFAYGPDGSTLSILTNNGTGGFVLASKNSLDDNRISSVIAADVNGDGKMDLICVNNAGLTVLTNASVMMVPTKVSIAASLNASQLSSGTAPLARMSHATDAISYKGFIAAFSTNVGSYPKSICAADVNGDGNADLICSSSEGINGTLTVLTNNGSGGFMASGTYIVGSSPQSVCAADVNGDGKVDLICASSEGVHGTLTVLTNNGSGGFVLASSLSLANGTGMPDPPRGVPRMGSYPSSVCAADVNGDGKLDLICANSGNPGVNTLTVFTNNGTGGFVIASTLIVGGNPDSVCAADVNGDGKMDLICANSDYDSKALGFTLSVLTNNGTGGFVTSSTISLRQFLSSVCAADVNGDGKVDLICANQASSTLTVLTNDGTGGFVIASSPVVRGGPPFVCAADVNGDGKVDLICANADPGALSTMTVLTNDGSGGFVAASWPGVGQAHYSVCAADVNGDGKVDLISANYDDSTLTVFTNASVFPPLRR
jgi:hypothetical protein